MRARVPAVLLLLATTLTACRGASDALDADAERSSAAITSGGVNATLALQSDWTAGYCTNLVLANTGTAAVTSWTLVVELNQSTLSNLWGGVSSVSGSQLTVKPADYTAAIPPGASVTLGFCATATGANYRPSLASLTVVGGGGPTTYALAVVRAGAGAGTVTSTPAGISCGASCSASFAGGTAVTLTAAPAAGSAFDGWGAPCTGTGPCVVTLTSAQSVTATFSLVGGTTYPVTVTRAGTGSGTVTSSSGGINCGSTCSASYQSGAAVTLTATAATNSTFAGWSGDCVGSSTCVLSMTAARAATATFTSVGGDTRPSAGCGKAPGISSAQYNNGSTISITAAGMQRRYILNVPTNYDNTRPYRLVIAYHELNGNDKEMYAHGYYHLLNLSNNSTIFVAPNGQKNGAPCTGTGTGDSGCGWPNTNNSDLQLADAVVAQIAQNFCVDMSRIFVTGWSYGGSMSYKTACERPQGGTASWSVRGAAVYSGAQLSGSCTPSKPVAYYASHGTGDSVLGYDMGLGLFQNFARANGCQYVTPTRVTSGNHVCATLSGCTSGFPTEFCSFNGGHTPDPSDGGASWEYQNVWNFFSPL